MCRAFLDKYQDSMNHTRIAEISTEMSNLLDKQRALLNDTSGLLAMNPEEIDGYGERNERLRNLCRELDKQG
jgi:hypothetical protein